METIAKKPICKLVGQDGNIFNLLGIASKTLSKSGLTDKISKMTSEVWGCRSYSEALNIIGEYVEIR